MQRVMKVLVLCATIAMVSAPTLAHADGYISPFIGANLGNNSGNGRVNVGADVGWMGAGVIGGELDFGYAPSFFGNEGIFGSNSVLDVMGNVIIGIPAGGQRGPGVRPYATIGVGLLRSQINAGNGVNNTVSHNDAGVNLGVGVMGYFSDHVGIRGDVRYFRDLQDHGALNDFNVDFGSFHFWRASFGVVLRP
jgi:hypothetical protein